VVVDEDLCGQSAELAMNRPLSPGDDNPTPFTVHADGALSPAPEDWSVDRTSSSRPEPSVSWACCFCPHLRVYEGGRPHQFACLDSCERCGSRIAIGSDRRAAVLSMIDRNLL
jgi:hypothetical protein